MKSLSLVAPRKLDFIEVPDPGEPGPGEVLLRVASVGICGSDVHYFARGRIGSQVVQYPFRVGHEFSARVEQVGPGVVRVAPGDRVAVEPAMPCYECDQCRAGRPHTCRQLRFLGCPDQAEGCLCPLITMPEDCCFRVPDGLDFDLAALVEPLSIGCYSVDLAARLLGARVAILGAGPIGLSVLLAAREAGVETVYVTEPISARREVALAMGADWAGHPEEAEPVEKIAGREPLGLDAVFECCGEQAAMDQGVEMLKPGGKLILVGIPSVDRVSFSIDRMRRYELTLQNVRRQNGMVRKAINLAEKRKKDLSKMVSHTGSPEDAARFFGLLDNYDDGVVKAVVRY